MPSEFSYSLLTSEVSADLAGKLPPPPLDSAVEAPSGMFSTPWARWLQLLTSAVKGTQAQVILQTEAKATTDGVGGITSDGLSFSSITIAGGGGSIDFVFVTPMADAEYSVSALLGPSVYCVPDIIAQSAAGFSIGAYSVAGAATVNFSTAAVKVHVHVFGRQ